MDTRIAALVVLGAFVLGESAAAQDRAFAPRRLAASELKVSVPQTALDEQFQALAAMPFVEVEYSRLGNISRLKGQTHLLVSGQGRSVQFDQSADEIFQKLRTLLVARGTEKLIVRSSLEYADGTLLSVKLGQTIRDVPVEGAFIELAIDTATGEIVEGSFQFVPDQGLPTDPKLAAQEAFRAATEALEASGKAAKGTVTQGHAPVLKYYCPFRRADVPRLTWEVYAAYPSPADDEGSVIVVIDAVTGELIDIRSSSAHAVSWPAWTAFNAEPKPATDQFPNGLGTTTDSVASATWQNAAQADQAWGDYGLGRTPRQIDVVVHYGTGFPTRVLRLASRDTGCISGTAPHPEPTSPDRSAYQETSLHTSTIIRD
jgi:hypothetical protein